MNSREALKAFSLFIQNSPQVEIEDIFSNQTCDNIDIYKNNYLIGHIKHLKSVYPTCELILGENNFKFFMSQFIIIKPPISENMNDYGAELSTYLESREELSEVFYITYLARLEWAIFDEKQPSIELPKGIYDLWKCLSSGEDPSDIEIDEDKIESIKFE